MSARLAPSPRQQSAMVALEDEWGESFEIRETLADGTIVVVRASDDPYYEPHPVTYQVARNGGIEEVTP